MLWCSICFTSLPNESIVQLPCNCINCSDCLTSWIATQAMELHYQTHEKIPCMIATCKKPFEVKQIFSQLTKSQQDMVNEILFDVYLKKTEDIRKCPENLCTYAGTIDLSMSCRDNLECSMCGAQWREKLHYTTSEKIRDLFMNGQVQRSELMSSFWEEAFTRRCPQCNVSIQKNGGCNHMTCKKCQYEFCWLCFQKHQGHSHRYCAYACFTKSILISLPIINVLWLTGIGQLVSSVVVAILSFLVGGVLLNLMLFFSYLLYSLVQKLRSMMYEIDRKRQAELGCFGLFGIIMVLLGIGKGLGLYTYVEKVACLEVMVGIVFKERLIKHIKRNRRVIYVYIRSYFQR